MPARSWIALRIDPLDTLFFRDGRPFDAANRVVGGLPTPQPLAGALRTALLARTGFDFAAFAHRRKGRSDVEAVLRECGADPGVVDAHFRGPFLALADAAGKVEPLLPMPAVLAPGKVKGEWSRSAPRDGVCGWHDPDRLLPLVPDEVERDPKGGARLITLEGVKEFLKGGKPGPGRAVDAGELYGHDDRVGIVIDGGTLTTVEGQLYAIRLLALNPKKVGGRRVCLYAEMRPGPEGKHDYLGMINGSPVPFGGEGKYVHVTAVDPVPWPTPDADRPRSLWYVATPTFLAFTPGDGFASPRPLPKTPGLKAAASGAGVAVSGWDVAANGPRATRFAVPAGAVYFIAGPGDEHGFLHHDNDDDRRNLRREGWGFALQGKWE
jgi:CRISPR-associated protein Cmr3